MHAFLLACVLIEGIALAVMAYFLRQSWRGGESNSRRIDGVLRIVTINTGITETLDNRISEVRREASGFCNSLQDRFSIESGDTQSRIEQLDARISLLSASLSELSEMRAEDTRDLGKRLTDAFDEIEKIRRKAGIQAGGAYDVVKSRAERASAKNHEIPRSELIALAEGK